MSNQQLMDHGNQMMDETDQAIERGKKCRVPALHPDRVFLGVAFEKRFVKAIGGKQKGLTHNPYLVVVQETINVGTETAAALKAQTEQMGRIVNELDSIHFSIKKASQLVKEIGRQVATDKCIMALLFLIVVGVIAIIIVKLCSADPKYWDLYRLVNPNNKDIRDIPGLAPPAPSRRLLWNPNQETS
ncbi:VESICLE TRANSPORT V-SNARE PROTEIN VTI1-RELATED [Salix koriyanagi]|uniref:VESICLE TRANSPORT V-SNARE PROTEIN VTI1-RELATED n=1 Tax=Salix koriyanagi TaxID=2511006 RepID=A0A9Q0PX52_9ROSI|nr:VESICLE TRANSPORT V-SNARE PROTEIN VTI1-RELATED [Salix koriyanagi]